MPIASPLPFLLYAKSWLLTSSDHLMSSLPLYNSLEYSWWIWKWEAKSSANSISACHFHCSLFIVLQCTENFSPAEKISYSFVLSPCFLFVLHLSVINPHPQHSLSKTAFLHTDLELCSCTQQQSTSPQKKKSQSSLTSSCLLGISTFFTYPRALKMQTYYEGINYSSE